MSEVRSVADANVAGKRVLVRVVLNVPLKNGVVTEDTRLKAIVPTIELIKQKGASAVIVMGYVGRPKGTVVEELRVAPIAARLAELTDMSGVEVLENLRFDPREEANDAQFAKELAARGDIYVNDAFADSHREYASIVGVPKLLPSYAGLLLEKEIAVLAQALTPPPGSVAIVGGAKFETKIPLIQKLLSTYSEVLLGGALANDVIKARGMPVGDSLVSGAPVPVEVAGSERLFVPNDVYVGIGEANAERIALINDVRMGESILDVGPQTAVLWSDKILRAPFILWNGPVGVYERGFNKSTDALAAALAAGSGKAVIGGGDTAAALAKHSFDLERVFISTGGGAMLEFLANGTLPGLAALEHSPA